MRLFLFHFHNKEAIGVEQNSRSDFQAIADQIETMLKTMQYGSITLVVQDGRVIQLEKNEKVRIR
jgi:hypothetical protein